MTKKHKTRVVECDESYSLLAGKMLIATPSIRDSLGKALIYVIEHDSSGGAVGLNVNQPFASVMLKDFLTAEHKKMVHEDLLGRRIQVFFGGPLESEKIMVLSLK